MLKLLSGTALAVALTTPALGQTGTYGEPLHRMDVQVCSEANGSPECRGVENWGVAPEFGLTGVSEMQPGTVAGQDAEAEAWQPDAGRGSTGAGSVAAGRGGLGGAEAAGDVGTGSTGAAGDTGTGDTDTGGTGAAGDTGAGDTSDGGTVSGGTS